MTTPILFAVIFGTGTAVGLLLLAHGMWGPSGTGHHMPGRWATTLARWRGRARHLDRRRVACTAAAVIVVAVWTRLPVAALLAAGAAWILPTLLRPDRAHTAHLTRIEAIAAWTEGLRDTLGAAAGLQQAIIATATLAPPAIRHEVAEMARRLRSGTRVTDALRDFADQIDDPTADLVVTGLLMAAGRNSGRVGDLLSSLASAARDQASLRMRIAATRATIRTSTRVISTVTLAMAIGLALFNRTYLAPYHSALGQLVLLAAGAMFAAGITWLERIATIPEPPRHLRPHPQVIEGLTR